MDINDFRVGQIVRGIFLEDEPVLIDGSKNLSYGKATPFTGKVVGVHHTLPGGPYVEVSNRHTAYLCDVVEIIEIVEDVND